MNNNLPIMYFLPETDIFKQPCKNSMVELSKPLWLLSFIVNFPRQLSLPRITKQEINIFFDFNHFQLYLYLV